MKRLLAALFAVLFLTALATPAQARVHDGPWLGIARVCQQFQPVEPCAYISFPNAILHPHVGDCELIWWDVSGYYHVRAWSRAPDGHQMNSWRGKLAPTEGGEGRFCFRQPGTYKIGVWTYNRESMSFPPHIKDVGKIKVYP